MFGIWISIPSQRAGACRSGTLERWRFLNQGPAFLKLIGRVVYRLEDVEAFEATQMRRGTKASAPPRSPAA
jgi:hypothetical protein